MFGSEIEKVCASSLVSEANSVHFTLDLPSQKQWTQVNFASEPTPRHQGFEDTVSILYHESMDAGWEHYPVYPGESGCRPVDVGMCPSTKTGEDNLLTPPTLARPSVPRPDASSSV